MPFLPYPVMPLFVGRASSGVTRLGQLLVGSLLNYLVANMGASVVGLGPSHVCGTAKEHKGLKMKQT